MRNHVLRLAVTLALAACFGCAPMGYVQFGDKTVHFDSASFATWGDRTVLTLSSEIKQSWELLATTRHVWIVFPGEPAPGACSIGAAGCSFRYVRNLGLKLGLVCTAREGPQPATCELPESFGEVADSGTVTVQEYVADDRLVGRFDVTTANGSYSGRFDARFDALTRHAAEQY